MKKYLFMAAMMFVGLGFTACSDDEVEIPEGTDSEGVTIEIDDVDPSADNIENWTNYCQIVAKLLVDDATSLYEAWNESYKDGDSFADQFLNNEAPYTSYKSCVQQIIDGCVDIASEVGSSKIGDPRNKWESGYYTDAVLAVESWFSWHSRDNYTNNIYSIRNAFYGTRDGSIAEASIAAYLKANNADLFTTVDEAITAAAEAIQAIQQPFRSHIGNASVLTAMTACSTLETIMDNDLNSYMQSVSNSELEPIIRQYVEVVVLPTYTDLVAKNQALYDAINELRLNPGTTTFYAAAQAWLEAREPWETSEAFLFGPVAELGLDPNMDSWPLDLDGIKNILESADFSQLEWEGDYVEEPEEDEESDLTDEEMEQAEAIAAAQNVRGYHTLEFLIFKDGEARVY